MKQLAHHMTSWPYKNIWVWWLDCWFDGYLQRQILSCPSFQWDCCTLELRLNHWWSHKCAENIDGFWLLWNAPNTLFFKLSSRLPSACKFRVYRGKTWQCWISNGLIMLKLNIQQANIIVNSITSSSETAFIWVINGAAGPVYNMLCTGHFFNSCAKHISIIKATPFQLPGSYILFSFWHR
jgi:hypothetical protein